MIKQIFFYSLTILFIVACTEIVEIEQPTVDGVVVNCLFFRHDTLENDTIKVFLTKTYGLFETYYYNSFSDTMRVDGYNIMEDIFIKNAKVYISKDSVNYFELNQKNRYYYYYQENFISDNKNYYLKVIYESDTIYSKTNIPKIKHISNPELAIDSVLIDGYYYHEVKFKIIDEPNYENFFILNLRTLKNDSTEYGIDIKCFSPVINYYNYIHSNLIMFSDENFQNQEIEISLFAKQRLAGYVIELKSISKELYSFYSMIDYYDMSSEAIFTLETGFSTPANPVTMYTNIINGYGIFAGYNICRDTIFY